MESCIELDQIFCDICGDGQLDLLEFKNILFEDVIKSIEQQLQELQECSFVQHLCLIQYSKDDRKSVKILFCISYIYFCLYFNKYI